MDDNLTEEFHIYEENNRKMRIPRQMGQYYISKKIIEVSYCVVVHSEDPESQKKIAIKCIPVQNYNPESKEVEIMNLLDHPNIIPCINSFFYPKQNPRLFAIVMPQAYMDLYDYIKVYGPMPENLLCKIMREILNTFLYIHSNGIWHRDIKPENIFLMNDDQDSVEIAIGDFGLSDIFTDEYYEGPATGTIEYAAPELIERNNLRRLKLSFKEQAICYNYLFQTQFHSKSFKIFQSKYVITSKSKNLKKYKNI